MQLIQLAKAATLKKLAEKKYNSKTRNNIDYSNKSIAPSYVPGQLLSKLFPKNYCLVAGPYILTNPQTKLFEYYWRFEVSNYLQDLKRED